MRSCDLNNRALFCPLKTGIVAATLLALCVTCDLKIIAAAIADSSERLQTLEVISFDRHQTGDVFHDELTGGATRIDRQTLERSPNSLAELVAHETGVQFRQSGGFGSYSDVSIRAGSAAQTGVYLDGILLNNGGSPVIDLSTLEMLNLGSVDIYRGSSPLQLGHASIGGAINLNTYQSDSKPGTSIRLDAASYSETGLHLAHRAQFGKWSFLSVASTRHSDNDFSFTNNNGTPLNPVDDAQEQRQNTQAQRTSGLLRLSHEQNTNSRTDLTLQLSNRHLGVPKWQNREANSARYDTRAAQFHLSQTIDHLFSWNTKHSLYWHNDSALFLDEFAHVGLGPDNIKNVTRTLGAKSYWEQPTINGSLGISMDIRNEDLNASDRLEPLNSYAAQRNSLLGSIHYTWFDSMDRWTITPAVRLQAIDQSGTIDTGDANHQRSRTGVQLGVAYAVNDSLSINANTGSYYREPSFAELYGSSGLINASPALLPEKGLNADLSLSYARSALDLNATVFASIRDELIVTAFDSRGVGRPVNSGKARVLGLELSVVAKISNSLNVRSNITWQDPRNKERQAGFYDKSLPGEATFAWFTRIQYQSSTATFWYELDVLKNRFYDQANLLVAQDSQQQSIGLDWKNKHWLATVALHNLNNVNLEDFNGFPKPGRHWSLSIRRDF